MNDIKLWEKTPFYDGKIGQPEPYLRHYPADGRACVIVCPGGAYEFISPREGEPVALWLNSIGISAFVLTYRVAPYTEKATTGDILRAVRVVRHNAANFGTDKNKIGVLGFSAGGHLASSAATHFSDFAFDRLDEADDESSRPDAAILCYPVISSDGEIRHEGSFKNLLGGKAGDGELLRYYSNEKQIKPDTPPCFLWHTRCDGVVPAENTLSFALGLQKNKIPYELHIYDKGCHGLALCGEDMINEHGDLRASEWTKSCQEWLRSINFR